MQLKKEANSHAQNFKCKLYIVMKWKLVIFNINFIKDKIGTGHIGARVTERGYNKILESSATLQQQLSGRSTCSNQVPRLCSEVMIKTEHKQQYCNWASRHKIYLIITSKRRQIYGKRKVSIYLIFELCQACNCILTQEVYWKLNSLKVTRVRLFMLPYLTLKFGWFFMTRNCLIWIIQTG